ncbi:MAG: iron ABC transporter permease [Anaerolineales bacterium]|nr:iron ABC transporter permease [Anaerolineales bacterium]
MMHQRSRMARLFWVLGLTLVGVLLLSIFIGRYPAPYWMSPSILREDELARRLLLSLRLPRVITALLMGMSLSAAGAVLQMVFRNPLVEPGFLGVSQGAAFGAALSILWVGSSPIILEISAIIFALIGLMLSYSLARRMRHGSWTLRLILSGIAVSALFSAGNGIMKYLADPLSQLPEITFWMLGGLWGMTWHKLLFIAPFVIVGLLIVYLMRWRLNLLSLSEETAFSLGTAPARERTLLLIAAVSATAAITSVGGIVGWIGLIVPHIARRIFGANAQYTIPASMIIGGMFTVICDNLARSLLPGEIPLGILTSLIGAVAFLGLMISPQLKMRI